MNETIVVNQTVNQIEVIENISTLELVTPGPQGPIGLQGTQGIQGRQGTLGTNGVQGLLGTQGTQGVQGLIGNDGFVAQSEPPENTSFLWLDTDQPAEPLSIYSAPTIGSTPILSNQTITRIESLELRNTTLTGPTTISQIRSVVPYGGFNSTSTAVTTDGINWTAGGNLPSNPGGFNYYSAVYGAGKHLIFGNEQMSFYVLSTDGINWTQLPLPSGLNGAGYFSPSFINGTFFLVKAYDLNVVNSKMYKSTDGINWTTQTLTRDFNAGWAGVTYGNGVYVAPMTGISNKASISTDGGNNWSLVSITTGLGSDFIKAEYGNGIFVTAARTTNNVVSNVFTTSTDGVNWTQRSFPITASFFDISFGNNTFVVTVEGNSTDRYADTSDVLTSTDGINWTVRSMPSSKKWRSVTYINGLFVVAADIDNAIAYSADGINWTLGTSIASLGNKIFSVVPYYSQDIDKIVGEFLEPIYSNSYTVKNNDSNLIFKTTGTCTITLPSPGAFPGRVIRIKQMSSFAVNSSIPFVQPLTSLSPGTQILSNAGGKFAEIVSDGKYWIVMQGN